MTPLGSPTAHPSGGTVFSEMPPSVNPVQRDYSTHAGVSRQSDAERVEEEITRLGREICLAGPASELSVEYAPVVTHLLQASAALRAASDLTPTDADPGGRVSPGDLRGLLQGDLRAGAGAHLVRLDAAVGVLRALLRGGGTRGTRCSRARSRRDRHDKRTGRMQTIIVKRPLVPPSVLTAHDNPSQRSTQGTANATGRPFERPARVGHDGAVALRDRHARRLWLAGTEGEAERSLGIA